MVMIGAAEEKPQRVSGEQKKKSNSSLMSCGSNLEVVMAHETNIQTPRSRRPNSICHKISDVSLS